MWQQAKRTELFSTSFRATLTGCDLIVYSDTSDPTEHLGCMIYVSEFFFFLSWSDASLSFELVNKLVFLLLFLSYVWTYW